MKTNTNTTMKIMIVAVLTLAAFGATHAQVLTGSDSIAGSWRVMVTPEGAPQPFNALLTFDDRGAVIGSAQGDILLTPPPGIAPGATPVHGAWVRTANRNYLFTVRQIFYNADGSYAGGAKIRNSTIIGRTGNEMSGHLIVNYYDENENEVFSGTGIFTATRITAESLTP